MLGIFGGSGFYELIADSKEINIDTPFGKPSDRLMIGSHKGRAVVFLARHGRDHKYPPHKIPYRANLWAMKELGVKKILAISAVGSLKPEIKSGTFVIPDSYIDRTKGREETFFDGPEVRHMTSIDPYCRSLRKEVWSACEKAGINAIDGGVMLVINGPRFSTKAGSELFAAAGVSVVNMTGYPEIILANELGICYINISLVTDYDACLHNKAGLQVSSARDIIKTFNKNLINAKRVALNIIENDKNNKCPYCSEKVERSKLS